MNSFTSGDTTTEFELPELPFVQSALEPYISAQTMSFHYGKHHQTYVDNLNKLLVGSSWIGQSLERIIQETAGVAENAAIFNNAAQIWNHTFLWHGMTAGEGSKPTGRLLEMIESDFGSFVEFKLAFIAAGVAQFGSGWVWLVQFEKRLKIVSTFNADSPMAHGNTVLLTCDVWEHAYYLDYQNRRKDFVQAFLDHLVNWEFVTEQLR
jgi:Fe-Mn family superoxide dismutase